MPLERRMRKLDIDQTHGHAIALEIGERLRLEAVVAEVFVFMLVGPDSWTGLACVARLSWQLRPESPAGP
jgi:hypothetical protein